MQNQISKKQGFTLAEILITLTVIGVVAALTIPTLLQNTNQAELKTALKRDFADLQQAALLIKNDFGGTLVNAFPDSDAESLKNAFKGKLSYIKECNATSAWGGSGTGASSEGCWYSTNSWQYLNGTIQQGANLRPGLILNNGTLVTFGMHKSDCSEASGDFTYCGYIIFDVNGFKKPNIIGKDIFEVSVTANELIPDGARGSYDSDEERCLPTAQGWACTAKDLYE